MQCFVMKLCKKHNHIDNNFFKLIIIMQIKKQQTEW